MNLLLEMTFKMFMGYGALGLTPSQIDKVLYIACILIIIKIAIPFIEYVIKKLKGWFYLW